MAFSAGNQLCAHVPLRRLAPPLAWPQLSPHEPHAGIAVVPIDPGFDSLIASTDEDADRACSILSADGETVIAQRLMREHAELIIAAVHAFYGSKQ